MEPTVVIAPAGPHWQKGSSVRPVDQPLAWIGSDRLLLDDVSRCGLRRRVIACKGQTPNQVDHLNQVYRRVGEGVEVKSWMVERDEFVYLWIVWKEG